MNEGLIFLSSFLISLYLQAMLCIEALLHPRSAPLSSSTLPTAGTAYGNANYLNASTSGLGVGQGAGVLALGMPKFWSCLDTDGAVQAQALHIALNPPAPVTGPGAGVGPSIRDGGGMNVDVSEGKKAVEKESERKKVSDGTRVLTTAVAAADFRSSKGPLLPGPSAPILVNINANTDDGDKVQTQTNNSTGKAPAAMDIDMKQPSMKEHAGKAKEASAALPVAAQLPHVDSGALNALQQNVGSIHVGEDDDEDEDELLPDIDSGASSSDDDGSEDED